MGTNREKRDGREEGKEVDLGILATIDTCRSVPCVHKLNCTC